jgi:hypothetical protein
MADQSLRDMLALLPREQLREMAASLAKAAALTPADYEAKYNDLADKTEAQLLGYADRLASGNMTPYQFRDNVLRTLRRAFADAYRFGIGASGERPILLEPDYQAMQRYLSEDINYLGRFTQQLLADQVPGFSPGVPGYTASTTAGRMDLRTRTQLYANALRAQFYSGLTSRSDPTQLWDWVLGASEHCGNCIDMAAGSPYTLAALGGRVPGADVCLGLDRCACSLVPH